jgi:hypothetical protein
MTTRFPCLHLEGGLLAADVLDQIADEAAPGQKAADFGLERRRYLTDEIAAAWTDARAFWSAFQHRLERLAPDDPATSVTRDQWMTPLMSLLGYELAYTPRAAEVDGQTYALSHRAGANDHAPPVHIVGCRQSLDQRPASGRPRLPPHSLLQEYLNRTEHLWGLATNGYTLRLLRNSHLIRRQAYIEFDLQQMLTAEKFADFALFYRLLHRTRLPHGLDDASVCLLEQYYRLTIEQGGRVREHLRDGVEEALKALANAFVQHPHNNDLREAIRNHRLTPVEFYQQLLRLIYRLLFLMVAEERHLITDNPTYREHYSITRLRRLAEQRPAYSDHADLWLGVQTTFKLFQNEHLGSTLDVPPLNGDLFYATQTAYLNHLHLTNRDFLTGLWHLSMYRENPRTPWRRINYAALDVEELGSVYESLLEFHPFFSAQAGQPVFELAPGTERKSTGSYYTPPDLVHELIHHALDPVIAERLQGLQSPAHKERVLLQIKVCDPACGSGHFLLAAARRLGRELAHIRTSDEEPTPDQVRLAIRDCITHCLYGVDKNPLAVDLCKVALWMEGHARGKPLTFLDHRIRCGDSLLGVLDPSVLADGILDDAFKPVAGDDKPLARALRRRNQDERSAQQHLPFPVAHSVRSLVEARHPLLALGDDTPEQVREKAETYHTLQRQGSAWWYEATACHLWAGAFFVPLTPENNRNHYIATTENLRRYLETHAVDARLTGYAWVLADQHRFFHWPLEFPEVFTQGGFEVILGNPPFMGGNKISGGLGDKYRQYLSLLYVPFKGSADLCTAFYRRAFSLLSPSGFLGMVATNTIGQGDTRESGLAFIGRNGGTITFAHRFLKWPGAANVEVNLVAVHKGKWQREMQLDGQLASSISSRLDTEPEAEPKQLRQNERKTFQGSIVLGMGFVLEPQEVERLIAKDPRNRDCLFPYLNGEDLNSRPDQSPSRWVINFFDWPLAKAETYPELIHIVREKVKPERDRVKRDRNRTRWWLYAENRPGLYRTIAPLQRVLVRSRVSELHMLAFVSQGWVYNEQTVVFAFDDDYHFTLLQSNIHEAWVWRLASSLESRNRYTPTDCFDTFPFPQAPSAAARAWAERLGADYHEHRRQVMLTRQLGLTKTYNLFHTPACTDTDIVRLRNLHAEMDRAILACYGWDDLAPAHDFSPNERGQTRFTVSPKARREVLHRLLLLNAAIAQQEASGQG